MALTGHLSDLSLSELIEFFCNQRKMGLLSVHYPQGSGSFYLQNGSVVDAKIGMLRGIDAVYYALTLPNAAFEFKIAAEPIERTINQPWTQVVLEGLRRLDEGIEPADAFLNAPAAKDVDQTGSVELAAPAGARRENPHVPAFLSLMKPSSLSHRKPLIIGLAAIAVLVSVAAIAVPARWYGRGKPAVAVSQPSTAPTSEAHPAEAKPPAAQPEANSADPDARNADAALAARRQKERERKAREDRANESPKPATASVQPAPGGNNSGAKKVTVQVTYDESGRVVQASGTDPTALRIARQKRFPAGKGGTATITIPIN